MAFFKFTKNFTTVSLQLQAWRAALAESLNLHINQAGIRWLNATAISKIPVWSGASRATFLHLAQELNFPIDIQVSPTAKTPRISLGLANSSGELDDNGNDGIVMMKYSTSLDHLVFNEYNNANAFGHNLKTPGPYKFQDAGADAFNTYLTTHRARFLPNPFKFQSRRKIK